MFELNLPWWEFPVRAVIIYSALLVMVRISGRRTVGQFTPFDLLVVMLLSEAVSNSLNASDSSVVAGLLSATTLILLNVAVAFITSRSRAAQLAVEGRAILIGRDGEIFRDVLKAKRLPLSDVEQALREADCPQKEMKFAFLEGDGKISILQKSSMKESASS